MQTKVSHASSFSLSLLLVLTAVDMFIREKEKALPPRAALMLHETLLYTCEIILHEIKEKEIMVSMV